MIMVIVGGIAIMVGIAIGFVIGGCWVCALNDSIKKEQGPPVRWSPEEYEIIKRQSKDFADAPWTDIRA